MGKTLGNKIAYQVFDFAWTLLKLTGLPSTARMKVPLPVVSSMRLFVKKHVRG